MVKAAFDVSFYREDPLIQGEIIMMENKNSDKVSSLFWKSKTVNRVCNSSKDAETRAGRKCEEDSVYFAERLEKMLFGDYQ